MAFTGKLGTSDSRPGNLAPGFAGASPPPPPPPPAPVVVAPLPYPPSLAVRFATRRGPVPPGLVPLPFSPKPGAAAQLASDATIYAPSVGRLSPVPGPWNSFGTNPRRLDEPSITQAGVVPPPQVVETSIFPPVIGKTTPVSGPWNSFGLTRLPLPLPAGPPNPPPPGVPPVPPAGTEFGQGRNTVILLPRVPRATDDRLRPLLDDLSLIANDLLRKGYIVATGSGEYAIVGGGRALPRDPAATDDRTLGAVIGMNFVNTLTQTVWVCVNNSVGSAVWRQVG